MKTEQYNNVLMVEVPEDAQGFVLDMGYLIFKIQNDVKKFLRTGKSKFWDATNLPPLLKLTGLQMPHGQYSIIGKGDALSDKDWEGIVENELKSVGYIYLDYQSNEKRPYKFDTPTESGHSLLASKGFSPFNNNPIA